MWITTKWKILRDGSTRPPYLPPKISVCRSRGKLEPNMEQQTGSILGQQYMNCELSVVQARFRKGRETRGQIANIRWIIENAKSSRKTSISALLTMPKPLTVWITINCGKGQFSFQSQRKAMPKNAQTTTQLHSSHMLVK